MLQSPSVKWREWHQPLGDVVTNSNERCLKHAARPVETGEGSRQVAAVAVGVSRPASHLLAILLPSRPFLARPLRPAFPGATL